METNIYRFILRHSLRQQVLLLALTLASFPVLYATLELPKRIVNDALSGKNVPDTVLGQPVDQVSYLLILSGLFLFLVLVNGAFKYVINNFKGRLGERILRRLRYELYARVLRFPLPRFRRMSAGEIIPMITAEVEPLGGFIGDALAVPVFQGGTLLVYLGFIFMQDPILGAAAVALYPFQGWLIPHLQRKVNQLGKQRVRAMRQISDRIGETVAGIQEVHAHDTAQWHLADIANRLGEVYDIRYEIYRRKFFIKFLNNFINQLTPFFFYSIGGYLVIRGQLSFGALVAVLAAYKDLAAPWKELLDWYQQKEDNRIKYEQVVEQFHTPDLMDPALQKVGAGPVMPLVGSLALHNVSFEGDGGAKLLDSVNCEIPLNRHVAVVAKGSGGDEFAQILARLLMPTGGAIRAGGQDWARQPESVTGRRVAYVGPTPHLFSASLGENLVYGLRHRPLAPGAIGAQEQSRRRRRAEEARRAGNTDFDILADWVDYSAAGCRGPEDFHRRVRSVLTLVGLDEDVYTLGLSLCIDPVRRPDAADRVLEAREAVRHALAERDLADVVEPFDPARYNHNATVAENLLFGTPVGPTFAIESLAENAYVLAVLDKVGLTRDFLEAGRTVAATMVEMFSGLPAGHEFFERFSFIGFADLPEFQALLKRMGGEDVDRIGPEDRARLMALPFRLIPARHRLGILTPDRERRMLEARRVFAADLPAGLRGAVEFFDPGRYNAAATVQDNILFGKIVDGKPQARGKIRTVIADVVDRLNLRDTIIDVGLDHPVGVAGGRLTAAQRQRVALARAVLKRPDLLVLNEATAGLDGAAQADLLAALRGAQAGRGLVWITNRASLARSFDHVLVLRDGRLVEQGRFDELYRPGTALHGLVSAE